MKIFLMPVLGLLLAISASAADSLEAARKLWEQRGVPVERGDTHARQAADMYARLASQVEVASEKAELLNRQSEALYWEGTHQATDEGKIAVHKEAYENSEKAVALLKQGSRAGAGLSFQEKELLGEALYWYGANLGKWGEPQSSSVKAKNWPKLKEAMNEIKALEVTHVQDYGVHRILGRAYFKLPWPIGGTKPSEAELRVAFDNTKAQVGGQEQVFSYYGIHNLFLAETLIAIGSDEALDEAQAILEGFVAADPLSLAPKRVPETKEEREQAKVLLEENFR